MMLLLRSILRDKPTVTYAAVIRYNQADPAAQKKKKNRYRGDISLHAMHANSVVRTIQEEKCR